MAKRPLDDAELVDGRAVYPNGGSIRKKCRNYNARNLPFCKFSDCNEEEIDTEADRKDRKRQEKGEQMGDRLSDIIESSTPTDSDDASKAAKKARKAERRALKLLRQDGSTQGKSPRSAITNSALSTLVDSSWKYIEHFRLSALPQAQVDSYFADNFISITDPRSAHCSFRPIAEFSYLPTTSPELLAPFKSFKNPTPIQAAAWPFLFAGRDVVGVAETGSGKTMAFAVPCIRYITTIQETQGFKGAKAVVISPTRELAMQSYEQITKLAGVAGLEAVCVYGGVPKDEQRNALRTADIVVATPGRLNDLINEGSADLRKVGYVVLDEADRMLDKGFEEEIRRILSTLQPLERRQTLMFTATWPESVRTLAATFMTAPVKIAIGDNPMGDLRANARIVQKVEVVDSRNKENRLLQLLKQYQSGSQKDDRILVFCLYKKEATRVEGFIRSKGIRVCGIHGDLSQEQRTRSLDAFKQGFTPVLVATDVAARGLDIPAVKLVINCTFPLTVEDYVHRIGRTGRAGKEGLAITLFTEHDKTHSGALINVLKAAKQCVPDELLKFGTTVKKKSHDAYGAFFKDIDNGRTATKIKFD